MGFNMGKVKLEKGPPLKLFSKFQKSNIAVLRVLTIESERFEQLITLKISISFLFYLFDAI